MEIHAGKPQAGSDGPVGKALPGAAAYEPGGQGTKVPPQKPELRRERNQGAIHKGDNRNFYKKLG